MVTVGLLVALQAKAFDAFADEAGREAHVAGQVAAARMEHAPELLAEVPSIETADVLGDKLPL